MKWDEAIAAFERYLTVERAYSPRTCEVYLRDVAALRLHLRTKRGWRPGPAGAQPPPRRTTVAAVTMFRSRGCP